MTATADPPQARPAPGPGQVDAVPEGLPAGVLVPADEPAGELRADLVESDRGWVLTLHLDPAAARTIRTQLSDHVVADIELGSVTASVLPNLVPGEPFAIGRLAVVVADRPGAGAGVAGDARPLPG